MNRRVPFSDYWFLFDDALPRLLVSSAEKEGPGSKTRSDHRMYSTPLIAHRVSLCSPATFLNLFRTALSTSKLTLWIAWRSLQFAVGPISDHLPGANGIIGVQWILHVLKTQLMSLRCIVTNFPKELHHALNNKGLFRPFLKLRNFLRSRIQINALDWHTAQ